MDAKTLGDMPAGPTMVYERDNYGRVKPEGKHVQKRGITLRQHYAGLAMQGLLAQAYDNNGMRGYEGWREEMGREAVRFADSLLTALAEEPTDGR